MIQINLRQNLHDVNMIYNQLFRATISLKKEVTDWLATHNMQCEYADAVYLSRGFLAPKWQRAGIMVFFDNPADEMLFKLTWM
jgi:hypothetical protein